MSNETFSISNKNGLINIDFDMDDDHKLYRALQIPNPAQKKTKDAALIYLRKYLQTRGIVLTSSAIPNNSKLLSFKETKSSFHSPYSEKNEDINLTVNFLDFKYLQIRKQRITNTQIVTFRQLYNNVPIYGSLATVELNEINELIGISINFGKPNIISLLTDIGKDGAESLIRQKGYEKAYWDVTSQKYYYFDSTKVDSIKGTWRLVYFVENRLKQKFSTNKFEDKSIDKNPVIVSVKQHEKLSKHPKLVDYIVDAQTGKIISELPQLRTLKSL